MNTADSSPEHFNFGDLSLYYLGTEASVAERSVAGKIESCIWSEEFFAEVQPGEGLVRRIQHEPVDILGAEA